MVKALLLVLVLAACTAAGRSLSNGRRRRSELLSELLAGMRVLRLRMLNSMEPVGILLRKSDAALLRDLGNRLWEGESLYESWLAMRAEETKGGRRLDCLTEGDLRILDRFFRGLGVSGREEQNELFTASVAELEAAHSGARKLFAEASKTYTALGALIGVGICIIIV